MVTETSIIPALAFLTPLAAGIPALFWKGMDRRLQQGLPIVTAALVVLMGAWMASRVVAGATLTTWNNELRVDGLSALMVLVIGVVALLASVYCVRYLRSEGLIQRVGADSAASRTRVFYGLLLWFFGTMLWASLTNNIVMLYVAIEATTLTSGLLVAYYWTAARWRRATSI